MPNPPGRRRLAPDHFRALAASGLRTPIGTNLLLHEHADPETVRLHVPQASTTIRRKVEAMLTEPA